MKDKTYNRTNCHNTSGKKSHENFCQVQCIMWVVKGTQIWRRERQMLSWDKPAALHWRQWTQHGLHCLTGCASWVSN